MTDGEPLALQPGLDLLRAGWPVIPLHARGSLRADGSPRTGSEPVGADWGLLPCTVDRLLKALTRCPDRGLGLLLGPSRGPDAAWLIDIEGDGEDAEAQFIELTGGELVDTPTWRSRRGFHRLFLVRGEELLILIAGAGGREGKGSAAGTWKLSRWPHLEWRIGGYAPDGKTVKQLQSAIPPTLGKDGQPREWTTPPTIPVAELPEAAYAALETLAERVAIQAEGALESGAIEPVVAFQAVKARVVGRGYGAAAIAYECDEVARTSEGDRHRRLRTAALKLGALAKGDALAWSDAEMALADASRRCGLPDAEAREVIDWARSKAVPRKGPISSVGVAPGISSRSLYGAFPQEGPGASWDRAIARIHDVEIPEALRGKRGRMNLEPVARVFAAFAEEAARRGDPTFYLSSRRIAKLVGRRNHKVVLRHAEVMCRLGFLTLVKPGVGGFEATGFAHTWSWHNPPLEVAPC